MHPCNVTHFYPHAWQRYMHTWLYKQSWCWCKLQCVWHRRTEEFTLCPKWSAIINTSQHSIPTSRHAEWVPLFEGRIRFQQLSLALSSNGSLWHCLFCKTPNTSTAGVTIIKHSHFVSTWHVHEGTDIFLNMLPTIQYFRCTSTNILSQKWLLSITFSELL